jgi:curli biogenesis system outer membrane secretion channel CsgG
MIMSPINRLRVSAILLGLVLSLLSSDPIRAQKILPEGIKDLATQIATNVAKEQKHKIAVLPFRELDGNATVLGTYISEELVTDLFMAGGLDIVERSMLDKILGEVKLGETGVIDQETATKVGKIAGVDAIVTGTITDLQSYVALNCRLIDARTGRIFGAAQAKIVKDDDVRKIMGAPLPTASATASGTRGQPTGSAAGSEGKQTPTKQSQQQQVNGYLFELKRCTLGGSSVECDLLITNNKEDRQLIIYSRPYSGVSRLIDPNGNEYIAADEVLLGSSRGFSSSRSILASGIPTRAKVSFEKVSPDIELARLVEIICLSDGLFRVQFRNVPLVRP